MEVSTVEVFSDDVADVPFDERLLKEQLKAWFRRLLSLPRKTGSGYRGRVTPLECVPLCVGLGQDGLYKLLDMREALDADPDLVWHEWLKIYGAELTAEGLADGRSYGARLDAADLLSLASGDPATAVTALVRLIKGGRRR